MKDETSSTLQQVSIGNKTPNLLKIVQLNAQGISNKINDIEVYVTLENPDILSVAEHWCSPHEISFMNIPGYVMAASYCRPNRQCHHAVGQPYT